MTSAVIFRRPRNLVLATFAGRVYRATGIDADGTVILIHDSADPPEDLEFTKYQDADVWVRTVRAEECDRVAQVSTVARYGRYQCQVLEINEDGTALLDSNHEAPEFEMIERGVYQKTVPVSELRDYHEIHSDLLFNYWRDRTIGSGSQVRP